MANGVFKARYDDHDSSLTQFDDYGDLGISSSDFDAYGDHLASEPYLDQSGRPLIFEYQGRNYQIIIGSLGGYYIEYGGKRLYLKSNQDGFFYLPSESIVEG